MNTRILHGALAATLLFAAPAFACGEGQFNTGQGLRYQGYLAPRPATVLVVSAQEDARMQRGLQQAGHRVIHVADAAALEAALSSQRFDVVIAALDSDAFAAAERWQAKAATAPRLLPVVPRSERNAPAVRSRFAQVLVDGASLGQTLKAINLAVAAR